MTENTISSNFSSNLSVFLRIKPGSSPLKNSQYYKILSSQNFQIQNNKIFPFDHIFTETSNSANVYQTTAFPLVNSFLEGFNATYFVYGQTGTGKTYTMGLLNKITKESTGIVPDSLKEIFSSNISGGDIYISFFQIYKDEIRDLFNPEAKGLIIMEKKDNFGNNSEVFIKDLIETKVDNYESAIKLINAGLVFRKMGSQV